MINLGSLQMPLNAATKTFAILAKRGAGKSYTGAVMAEEFAKHNIPFVVFDPIDVWWGLRLDKNGKDKGIPVVVFGLRNADIPLDRDMGRQIAQAVVRENISCIISTFGMPKVAQRHLIAEFAEELLNINNTPRHVIIEEAHEFVPQRVLGGIAKCFSAVEALVTMGRNVGIGVTMLNQRAATLNKDVLTQIDTLIAMRSVGPQDRKALREWVEVKSAEGDFEKFIASLPSLPTGEAWVWSPEFLDIFERIKVRKRETFHPDREKMGDKFVMPDIAQTDLQGFISKFTASLEAQRAVPVKKEKGAKKGSIEPKREPTFSLVESIEQVKRKMQNDYESQLIEKDSEIRRLSSIIAKAAEILGRPTGNLSSTSISVVSSDKVQMWQNKLGSGLAGRIFKFFVENPSEYTRDQIALGVGTAKRSGHYDNEMSKLTRNNLLVRDGSIYKLNPNL